MWNGNEEGGRETERKGKIYIWKGVQGRRKSVKGKGKQKRSRWGEVKEKTSERRMTGRRG